MAYIGRFAPSPTGPLHFGSLVAATASFLDARANNGQWLVRMEDLDKPREVAGAAKEILNTLVAYGFEWDGDIWYQSKRIAAYETAMNTLKSNDLVYPCTCSRKQIADASTLTGIEGVIYPGTCLQQAPSPNTPAAWRIKAENLSISFNDLIQRKQTQNLKRDIGDFILKRADGLFAYQLAVVVDDSAQHVTHIVRGADLLHSTIRQIFLQQKLGITPPVYMHIPIVKNAQGEKLSKQTQAAPISTQNVNTNLFQAFSFLKLNPPQGLLNSSISENWSWATSQWQTHYPVETLVT